MGQTDGEGHTTPSGPKSGPSTGGTGIRACTPSDFKDAAEGFLRVHDELSAAINALAGTLKGCGGMAGTDSGAKGWAGQYDPACGTGMSTSADLVTGAGMMHDLLAYTGAGRHNADNPDAPVPAPGSAPAFPVPDVPKAFGGDSGTTPGWWTLITSYVQGFVWPNGNTGKLKEAGTAYKNAAAAVRCADTHIPAIIGLINQQRTPEVPAAAQWCSTVQSQLNELAAQFDVLGKACEEYAQHIDDAHNQIIDAAIDLAWQTVLIESAGALLSVFSFGAGEAGANAVEVSRLSAIGERIANICRGFAVAAEASGLPAVAATGALARVTIELRPLLDARAILYTTLTGKRAEEAEAAAARAENMTVEQFEAKYGKPGAWKYPEESDPAKPYAVPGTARNITPEEWKTGLSDKNIDRYGSNPVGGWLAPEGTSFEARAMAPDGAGAPLTTYRIGDGPLPPGYKIEESKVAPWFGSPGGGTQFRIIGPDGQTAKLTDLIKSGLLVEVKK